MTAHHAYKFLPGQLVKLSAAYRTKRFTVSKANRDPSTDGSGEHDLTTDLRFRFVQLAGVQFNAELGRLEAPTALVRDEGGTWRVPLRLLEAAANQPVPKQQQLQQQPQEAGHGAEGDRVR